MASRSFRGTLKRVSKSYRDLVATKFDKQDGKFDRDLEAGPQASESDMGWHVMDVEGVCAVLDANVRDGLSEEKVATRLEKYGPNELSQKRKTTMLERIWRQINNVLVYILLIVALISGIKAGTSHSSEEALTGWIEVGLILGVIALNTWIGIRQEGSAEKSAEALKAMLSSSATVIRDGTKKEIPAKFVVPGDLVHLSTGARVPADLRLVKATNFACQEAALTGESLPVDKITVAIETRLVEGGGPSSIALGDRKNMAFSATLVTQGEAVGIVVGTGDDTEIGAIHRLVGKVAKKRTNVLIQIDTISKFIALFVIVVAICTFCASYFMAGLSVMNSVETALVTSVAMIPEGLAAIVTLTYGYAVNNMAKHNAIVRTLPAVETLGSVNVICSDKTGTLTKNEMTMVGFVMADQTYRFNIESKERSVENFTLDNQFLKSVKMAKTSSTSSLSKSSMSSISTTSSSSSSSMMVDGYQPKIPSPTKEQIVSMLECGILCSNATIGKNGSKEGDMGNPTELAIVRAAYFGGVDVSEMRERNPIIAQVPFSSEYKFMATVHDADRTSDHYQVFVKGAPDRLLALSSQQTEGKIDNNMAAPLDLKYWEDQISILGKQGLRVLALCQASVPKGSHHAQVIRESDGQLNPDFVSGDGNRKWLTLVGLCPIMDPPRPECVQAIKVAHHAGVSVKMITGDHKDTAIAIGGMLGIASKKHPNAITGPEMDRMSDEEMARTVMENNVFARASPENKLRIVKALQFNKQVSSMTGDGVNDAPALKAADMGVAMGKEGTDVARESAEMILADDNFATIVAAVREGRVVWDNLRKILLFNTPVNNAQGLSVLFGMLTGLEESPLTPIQVLYCNLICAVTLGMVLAVEPAEEGIMDFPPRRVGKRLIGRFLLLRIAIGTIILVLTTVGSVWWLVFMEKEYTVNDYHSQASNTLTFGAVSICLSARFAHKSSFHPRLFRGNPYAWGAVLITVVLQLCITYIPGLNDLVFQMSPMDGMQWAIVVFGMVTTFVVMEIEKLIRRSLAKTFDTDDQEFDPYFDAETDFIQEEEGEDEQDDD